MTRNRHASRASFACVRCKKDKRRCDIADASTRDPEGPRCTACRNRNETCEVRYGEDKRSSRQTQDNKALHRRIAALEDLIKNMSHSRDTLSDQPTSHEPEPDTDAPPAQGQQLEQQQDQYQQQSVFLSPTNSTSPYGNAHKATPPGMPSENWTDNGHSRPSRSVTSVSFSSQVDSSAQDIAEFFPSGMDEVAAPAARLGRHASARNSQYFGSPSLFPYSERQSGPERLSRARLFGGEQDTSSPADEMNQRCRAALEASPEPEPIVAHLIDLFWKWQSCHLLVIDREIFLRHRRIWDESGGNGDRTFYTPCLLYALLAMAALISPDAGVKRYSTYPGGLPGDKFAQRSRALFELEIEQPTITTVQAALILGSRYGAMVDNSLGWTYSGIAFRIASKLGLHLDCTKAIGLGHVTAEAAKLRRIVFWGCHIEDNLFSSYCSRPTFFMDWDITTPLPPPPLDSEMMPGSTDRASLLSITSSLSLICSRTLVNLYGQRRQNTAPRLRSLASQLHRDLWQWYQDLPAGFTLADHDEAKVLAPEVFILHMHFYFALILLHRPFLQFSQVLHDLTNLEDLTSTSTGTCAIAAANITKLVLNYQRFYSIRQVPSPTVHFAFISGTIHLVNYRLTKMDSHYQLLQSSMSALTEIRNSYPIAGKAASVLQELLEGWEPSKEADLAAVADVDIGRSDANSTQRNFDWLEIEVPPLMETQEMPDFGACSLDNLSLATSAVLPENLDIFSQGSMGLGAADPSMPEDTADWPSERFLFESFYGSAFALG